MEVKLLNSDYKKQEHFYQDFLNDNLRNNDLYFSNEIIEIKRLPDFPIYMGRGSEEQKKQDFLKAFQIVSNSYLDIDQEIVMEERFWHSLLVTEKRDYILNKYPEVMEGENKFRNVVLKKFDWENYIYKVILGAQYINDNIKEEEQKRYYELIVENLDLYNYIIKYEIFRNDKYLINILDIIDELNLSKILKAKIKGREDLGDDERYGRRVIFEFNKSYPIVMSPMLEKEELKKYFIEYLSLYYDPTDNISQEEFQFEKSTPQFTGRGGTLNRLHQDEVQTSKVAENQVAVQVIDKKEESTIKKDDLLTYLERHELEYVDHRAKGGSIWVIGDRRLEPFLKPLEDEGIYFKFKPVGGRASKNRPAWFWYGRI